jgi:hypothetical protein
VRPNATEKSFFLRKGTNYPIYLSDLMQSLGRPNQDTGTPGTSETYTAAILPPTNGTPRAYVFTDPQNRLGTNKVWTNSFPVNPTVPIGTVTVARIEVLWTNVVGNVALDTNPNAGDGLRVFTDRLTPTDGTARNVVRVRVRTTPPMAGQVVRLKSFDVDDPMYPLDPNDVFVDTNDVSGAQGDDNRGTPLAGQLASTLLTLNASGEALTNFTVTMQPGNNFRVAAILDTPGAQAHLDKLHVTNSTAPFYVGPDSNPVRDFVGGISPMLTVWRKLHLEFDSMLAPPASGPEAAYVNAKVTAIRLNQPVTGRSLLNVAYETISLEDGYGLYQRGRLEIPGIGTFKITTNTWTFRGAVGRTTSIVEIDAAPAGIQTNASVKLYDDDDQFLTNGTYASLLALQSPPLPVDNRSVEFITNIQHRFWAAYIQPVSANTNGLNTQSTIAFVRQADLGGIFDSGNQQLKGADAAGFWAYTMIFAYESLFLEDGDPNPEIPLSGVTLEKNAFLLTFHEYSVVYMEGIRERVFGVDRLLPRVGWRDIDFNNTNFTNRLEREYLQWLYGTIAHEIGHSPGGQGEGADHAEEGLMQEGGDFMTSGAPFSPKTIRRFRNATKWIP